MYIIASIANLRTEGNTDSTIIEQLPFRTKVTRIQIFGTWSKVITTDGVTGYIFSEFLSSRLPQVKPTSPPPRILTKWPAVSTLSETFYNADLQKYYGKPYEKSSLPLKGITVILDPGHGGSDPGAIQQSNGSYVYEKTINLQVSLKIGDILAKYGADVIYTRKTDVYRGLYFRVALINKTVLEKYRSVLIGLADKDVELTEANRLTGLMDIVIAKNTDDVAKGGLGVFLGFGAHKDLRTIMDISRQYQDVIVISVHCNRVLNSSSTKGAEIFYGTANAIYLDEKKYLPEEPRSDPLNPSYMYYDENTRKSLATSIRDAIRDKTAILTDRGDYNSLYTRNYCMIREHNLTSSLVELGYLSNPSDRSYLVSSNGQTTMAGSIAYAVFNYFCR
ncbi:MAG: N-acetylmuramoyl-L-alanine amidase [Saccharofermentanales bacterium]